MISKMSRPPRRCPVCGYTAEDKRVHGDHHLCPQEARNRQRRAAKAPGRAALEQGGQS
jgi:transposase